MHYYINIFIEVITLHFLLFFWLFHVLVIWKILVHLVIQVSQMLTQFIVYLKIILSHEKFKKHKKLSTGKMSSSLTVHTHFPKILIFTSKLNFIIDNRSQLFSLKGSLPLNSKICLPNS